jgi:hypothetical protein
MLQAMTGINRETAYKLLVKNLKKKNVCDRFVPHLLTPDQKHQRAASSVEFFKMVYDDRNV